MQADRIYCGDALTVLKTLPDSSVRRVFPAHHL